MGGLFGELIKSFGTPVASLLIVVFGYFRFSNLFETHFSALKQDFAVLCNDVNHLSGRVDAVETATVACKKDRVKAESEIHGRVTNGAERISKLEGRMNGRSDHT